MITFADKLDETMRELRLRRRAFPAWVREGRMDQAVADRRIAVMAAIVEDYRAMVRQTMAETVGGSNGPGN